MATIEERVAYLEGKVEEHSRGFGEIRDLIVHTDGHVLAVDRKVDRAHGGLTSRMDAVDQKVDRFREELAARIEGLDQKVDRFRDELAARIDGLDQKVDRFREELAARIDGLDEQLTSRIDGLDQQVTSRIDSLDQKMTSRIDSVDRKVDHFREELAAGMAALDAKVSRQFIWLVGIQVAVLVAVVSALLGD